MGPTKDVAPGRVTYPRRVRERSHDADGRDAASRDRRGPEGRAGRRASTPAGSTGPGGATADLPPGYLACLQVLEALPENLPGADKTWVEQALAAFREHYRQARRVR